MTVADNGGGPEGEAEEASSPLARRLDARHSAVK